MEKEILQELMYDLDREKGLISQINLVVAAADKLCGDEAEDAVEAEPRFGLELDMLVIERVGGEQQRADQDEAPKHLGDVARMVESGSRASGT